MSLIENKNEFVWTEKYRPSGIKDVIIPDRLRKECEAYVKDGQIPHLLFTGGAGIGKTTVAYALANMIDADLLYVNASNENGVDTIRTKVSQFASTASMEGNLKVVLLDEADGLTEAGQKALRGFIEEFSQNTRFIFTANYKNKIIDAIQSRCTDVDFSTTADEKQELTMKAWKRCMEILKEENVEFDKKTVATIVARYYPDMRRVMNAIQKAAAHGAVNDSSLAASVPTDVLFEAMKAKKFGDVRKWVAQNADDYQAVFRDVYDRLLELFSGPCIPQIVILLDMYQERVTRTADCEITLMACVTEIMATAEWK